VQFNDVCNFIAASRSSLSAGSEELLQKMNLTWTTDGEEKYIQYKVTMTMSADEVDFGIYLKS